MLELHNSNAFRTMKDIVEHKIPKMLSLFESIIVFAATLKGYDMSMFSLSKVKRYYETGVKSAFGEQLIEFGYPIDAIRRIKNKYEFIMYLTFEKTIDFIRSNIQEVLKLLDSYEQSLLRKFLSKC